MPTFEFNDGGNVSASGSNASLPFTDDGVSFTISTSGNTGVSVVYVSPTVGGDGQFSISETAPAPWVLDVNAGGTLTNFSGNISLQIGNSLSGSWDVVFVFEGGGSTTRAVASTGQVISVSTGTTVSEIRFVSAGTGYLTIDNLTATIVCYLEDTGIDTPKGRVAVQDLREGDRICLADGGETTVKWVGIQPVDTRTAHPAKVNPICITAGAIADNVPERDLFVSPDHAIEIDGRLYNASALVNGASIYKVAQMPQPGFTYYHIETEAHEVILAEGCPAESYLDMPDRTAFVNGSERADAARISEMPLPRIVAKRMVPADVADRLAARIKHRSAA